MEYYTATKRNILLDPELNYWSSPRMKPTHITLRKAERQDTKTPSII